MKKPVLSLSADGVKVSGGPGLERLARHFQKHDFVRLPGFFPKTLLAQARKDLKPREFYRRIHKDISVELCMRSNLLFCLLQFIANDRELFRSIEKITNCGGIGCFIGRIYRMNPGRHYDSWHDDRAHHRLIAMSVNLSEKKYRGGFLMLRSKGKAKTVRKIINTGFGDAILFRLGRDLEHQVAEVKGTAAKTAYAGWFCARPDYFKSVKQLNKKKTSALL